MLDLVNKTPFAAAMLPSLAKDGSEHLVVVAKATFLLSPRRGWHVADAQVPIAFADVHHGHPLTSSLRYASDGALRKPGVLPAPEGKVAKELEVHFADSNNPKANIAGDYTLLGKGVKRVHPAGYAADRRCRHVTRRARAEHIPMERSAGRISSSRASSKRAVCRIVLVG